MKSIRIQVCRGMFSGFSAMVTHPNYNEPFIVEAESFDDLECKLQQQLMLCVISDLKRYVIMEGKRLGSSIYGRRKSNLVHLDQAVKLFSRKFTWEALLDLADEIMPFIDELLPGVESRFYANTLNKITFFKLVQAFDSKAFLKPYKSKYYKEIEAL